MAKLKTQNSKIKTKKLFLLIVGSLILGILFASCPKAKIRAQVASDSTFLTISPPVRELELPPGSRNSYQVSLLNQSNRTLTVLVRASPFVAAGETGGVDVSDEELPETQDWVIVNPAILSLAPNERKEITYTITLPKNAPPGGFYFAITAQISSKIDLGPATPVETKGGSAVNFNVASLNIVRISGKAVMDARITEFSTPKKLYEYGPVPFVVRILNMGNVHIKPLLEINVRNTLGNFEKTTLHLKQQNILPGAQRKYEQVEYPGKWHFGRYVATLTGIYGDGQNLNYTISFWIIPWRIILVVVLAILIVGLIGYLLGKRKGSQEIPVA